MVAQLESQRTLELMAAVILFGAFDPDGKVPDHPEPEAPARPPTTAKAVAEDLRAPRTMGLADDSRQHRGSIVVVTC